jgi:hypothetical protein
MSGAHRFVQVFQRRAPSSPAVYVDGDNARFNGDTLPLRPLPRFLEWVRNNMVERRVWYVQVGHVQEEPHPPQTQISLSCTVLDRASPESPHLKDAAGEVVFTGTFEEALETARAYWEML